MRSPVFVYLAFAVAVAAWSACPAADVDAEKIDRLIRQLGSSKFEEREAAGHALETIGKPALAALRKAASTSEDAEVRRRASRLVEEVLRESRPASLDCTGKDGANAAEVRQARQAWAKHLGRRVEETIALAGGVKMTFALVPPGKFPMGCPPGEAERDSDETQHRVTLTGSFYLGVHEVTQAQWQAVMGGNPSRFQGENLPVEQVSWDDCQEFCSKLGEKVGKRYFRLPTEAEWEYACRAGTTTPLHFGATLGTDQANYDASYVYGSGKKGLYRERTTPVGSFPANAWGLFDMHGNVWEWCQDWYGPYASEAVEDPRGANSGDTRVLRGGSWLFYPGRCRSAGRDWRAATSRSFNVGCRLVLCLD
jgi:formylglycine-generating enzyme